jgi:hypothetical protein
LGQRSWRKGIGNGRQKLERIGRGRLGGMRDMRDMGAGERE